jgi:hypothetical protein
MAKRCEGMLEKIDGTYEQCDNLAQHGSDFCWECRQLEKKKAVQLSDEAVVLGRANEIDLVQQDRRLTTGDGAPISLGRVASGVESSSSTPIRFRHGLPGRDSPGKSLPGLPDAKFFEKTGETVG